VQSSFQGRHSSSIEEKERLGRPGPGQYEPHHDSALKKSPSYKMGNSKRESRTRDRIDGPGPESYDPRDVFTKTAMASWGFGTGKRDSLTQKTKDGPGPNSYNIPPKFANEGPKYHIQGRTIDHVSPKKDFVPGPGTYEGKCDSRVKNEPSFSMGNSKRADLASSKEKLSNPGPGNYENTAVNFTRQAPKYGFGSQSREESPKQRAGSPGPGAYQTREYVGKEGPQRSMGVKANDSFEIKESRNKPGPGAYESFYNATLKQMPSYKIGSSKRVQG